MADTTLDPKNADKRTAERYIRRGQLDEKAWTQHLANLPDAAEKSVPVESLLDDADDFDDEDEDEDDAE